VGILILFLISEENSSAFLLLSVMWTVVLSCMTFVLRYIPSVPNWLIIFIVKAYWILPNLFSICIGMTIWFLFFILLRGCITCDKTFFHPWDKYLDRGEWSLTHCWIWLASILSGICIQISAYIF
jgi:hypothetical protein